ncbi:MAG: hypothetical protein P8Y27_00885 [Chromatiaceae bacterium]
MRQRETNRPLRHRHTGRTHVPLTRRGEREALAVVRMLTGLELALSQIS